MAAIAAKTTAIYALLPALVFIHFGSKYIKNQRYVELYSGKILYNSHLYEKRDNLSEIYSPTKAFTERINNTTYYYAYTAADQTKSLKLVNSIANHTVKLVNNCGSAGTGWFLDWELPEEGRYPTKWFVATNAHVISNYVFLGDPYLHISPYVPLRSNCYSGNYLEGGQTHLYLIKDLKPNTASYAITQHPFSLSVENTIGTYATSAKEYKGSEAFIYSKIEKPKKFYVPLNFLGKRYIRDKNWEYLSLKSNYLRDFAVLEVNFSSEDEAKAITDDLYNKVKKKEITEIDVLAKDLLSRQTGDDLANNQEHYYSGGYPGSQQKGTIRFSFEAIYSTASPKTAKFATSHGSRSINAQNSYGQDIVGVLDVTEADSSKTIDFYLTKFKNWGYAYLLSEMEWAKPGSSGSLVIDSQGRVLGLLTSGFNNTGIITITPLRSDGLLRDSKIFFPKYDLIQGTEGQIGSYKESLDKTYPHIRTHLRDKWSSLNPK